MRPGHAEVFDRTPTHARALLSVLMQKVQVLWMGQTDHVRTPSDVPLSPERGQGGRWTGRARLMMLAAVLTLGTAACGAVRSAAPAGIVIDDAHPSYRGVSLGDTHKHLIARLGKAPVDTTSNDVLLEPYGVSDDDYAFGLPVIGPDPPPFSRKRPPIDRTVSYRHLVFAVSSTRAGVYYFAVTAPGARTKRGVGIGDSLTRARKAYGGVLRCDMANKGTEYTTFPYCGARLARHRYIYFGQDPIRSIAFASTWLP